MSVARLESGCLEADVAALMTWQGLAEARRIRSDLRRLPLRELAPEPGEISIPVDDVPNPFKTPPMADRCLRPPEGVVELSIPYPGSWQHLDYASARAFRVVSQAGTEALPALRVFGYGDTLSHRQRADKINECLRDRHPFALIKPIDNITAFLAIDGEDRHASVAIVARNLRHVAVAVAAGSTVAVGTHHAALIRRDGGSWIPATELPAVPVLHGSIAAPIGTPGRSGPQTRTLFPECGNPILLSGVILGSIEAAYQPDFWPCDGAAMYIAAAAGRTIVRAVTGRQLAHPDQVQGILVNALRKGEKVPGLIAARDELAARRALTYLRRCGIA
jgi:hypothetical protein